MARQIIREGKLQPQSNGGGITRITVGGFKSIVQEQSIEIKPLTILAGSNSTGKSSMMQPLLLLKQTLEASFDPGPLWLYGPNVKFTATEQLLSRIARGHSLDSFQVGVRLNSGEFLKTQFRKEHQMGFRIEQMHVSRASGEVTLWPGMSSSEIVKTGV